MKKGLLLLMLSLLGVMFTQTVSAWAEDKVGEFFNQGGIQYKIAAAADDKERGEVTVTYCGEDLTEVIIPELVTYEGNKYAVTKIAMTGEPENEWQTRTFEFIEARKIVIPASVKVIEDDYWYFENIESITFECSYSAIENMKYIEFLQGSMGVMIYAPEKELSEYKTKFANDSGVDIYDCSDLYERSYKGVNVAAIGDADALPNRFIYEKMYYEVISEKDKTVKLIGGANKYVRTSAVIEAGYLMIPEKVYCNGVEFTVTQLGQYSLCDVETVVKMPNTVTKIEPYVFDERIVGIYMSDGITKLPSNMFCGENDSPDLSYVKLPANLKTIPKKAFYKCRKLRGAVIPESVELIGAAAFYKYVRAVYLMGDVPENIYRSVGKLNNTTYYIAKENVKELETALGDKLGKAKVLACNFKEVESVTLNKAEIDVNSGSKWRLKATLNPKDADYKLAWISNKWGYEVTQGRTLKQTQSPEAYENSAVYVFEVLSGKYAFCRLVQ